MFLKTLTLKGFKSFAEATTLDLEPGVTVVVGPNGSGKSNVVDAVAWVLGAQGPRTVRSSRMDDVIFAGSSRRPALGRAEVTLTIDNSSGRLPIEVAEVTITRTLFRSGDSEYALNGASCRLLDVQELLSDTGVGRQQHVIVGQGQLDGVLSARPEDRRLLIEEAAGVLKYRRRRERAERRIEAAEVNLTRLGDLLAEVRRQLRPLRHQAEAVRRHDGLARELRAVRLHLAGRQLAQLADAREACERAQAGLGEREASLRGALATLDASVTTAEAGASSRHQVGGAETLRRLEALRERARGLTAVLVERRRSAVSALDAAADEGVAANLEAEAARLVAALATADADAAALVPRAEQLALVEVALVRERAGQPDGQADSRAGEPLERAAAEEARQVAAQLATLGHGVARDQAEVGRVEARLATLTAKADRLAGELADVQVRLGNAEGAGGHLEADIQACALRTCSAAAVVAQTEPARRAAEERHYSSSARVESLAMALDEVRCRAGVERLAGLTGLLGPLIELIEVDRGWERAFAAAAGDALAALVLDGPARAAEALERLAGAGLPGVVLPAAPGGEPTVPAELAPEDSGAPVPAALELDAWPAEVAPVRRHVRSIVPGVNHLLDLVLAGAVVAQGDWRSALEVARLNRHLVVVTLGGDRFAPSGWRTGTGSGGVTGAALNEAKQAADQAALALELASQRAEAARAEDAAARATEAEVIRAVDRNAAQRRTAVAAQARLVGERADLARETEATRAQLDELHGRIRVDEDRARELEERLPGLEATATAWRAREAEIAHNRAQLDDRMAAFVVLRTDLEVRAAALHERRRLLAQRLEDVERQLVRHSSQRDQVAARRLRLEAAARAVERLAGLVDARLVLLENEVAAAEERHHQQAEEALAVIGQLESLRAERMTTERQLSEVRERLQRAGIDMAETRLRWEAAADALRRELDCEPGVALEAPRPPQEAGVSVTQRARDLERELRLLGPVNPLALEELAALEERHTFVEGQREDVRSARRELAKVIRAVDAEIVDAFAAAYEDVAKNFEGLFATLFPGGTGRLRLTDPADMLGAGVEVEARPAGKNVRKLSLLSGGERSLVALAFLFAVFRSRPSPFYLLDEVEAALDDVNLHRFLGLVEEFRHEAQLVIVTHQKRTMEIADCLYGVTMAPGGSSRVLSERTSSPA
ncbi:MAG: chromosome segregation protein SMC [Acidimicrobiales bacterium]|nr:MAG: chromosome segregation protein SMC [Acidimicrobiales bacterium]